MTLGDQTKARMVRAAAELLSERGVAGTSFREVLERSHAPRGSIYFHFRDGKSQLLSDAVGTFGERWLETVRTAIEADVDLATLVRQLYAGYRRRFEASGGVAACPVGAAASDEGPVMAAAADVFEAWRQLLRATLHDRSVAETEEDALGLADLLISSFEGALLLCRAERSTAPLDRVESQVLRLLEERADRRTPARRS